MEPVNRLTPSKKCTLIQEVASHIAADDLHQLVVHMNSPSGHPEEGRDDEMVGRCCKNLARSGREGNIETAHKDDYCEAKGYAETSKKLIAQSVTHKPEEEHSKKRRNQQGQKVRRKLGSI